MLSVHAVEGIVSAACLLIILYGPWQWICTDMARQAMFSERDAMFDLARRGQLDFGSPEYRTIREEINNLIRFAHRLTWVRLAMFMFFTRGKTGGGIPARIAAKGIKDEKTRQDVLTIIGRVQRSALRMLLMKSPGLAILAIITVFPVIFVAVSYVFFRDLVIAQLGRLDVAIQTEASHARG